MKGDLFITGGEDGLQRWNSPGKGTQAGGLSLGWNEGHVFIQNMQLDTRCEQLDVINQGLVHTYGGCNMSSLRKLAEVKRGKSIKEF